ncbi:hypothetical protein JKI95_10075 [Corynebacterium aquatimens]|uniref:hypothetical protein n=1 Tax=Corynebacterium aquatimens TaxID=1190508 RepID=UPI0025415B1E|nr:hypothetical protein [Corynebacterium aquatimens]QYH19428.1 hypothetical protein JKI95_10075 [Corynebacterium aquatimens]
MGAAAQQRVNQIQRAAGTLGARSRAMAGHVEALGTVAASEQVFASAVMAAYVAAPPPAKPLIEQSYLASFGPRMSAQLMSTVPAFTQLLPDLAVITGIRSGSGRLRSRRHLRLRRPRCRKCCRRR